MDKVMESRQLQNRLYGGIIVLVLVIMMLPQNLFAQWPTSPDSSILLSAGYLKQAVSDGMGGAYVVLNGMTRANCSRITHEGNLVWNQIELDGEYHTLTNEIALSSDNCLLVTYYDQHLVWDSSGDSHVKVQKITPDGEKMWGLGRTLTPNNATGSGDYFWDVSAKLTPDPQGGAYVVWTDLRNDISNIYVQHINAFGELLWDSLGVQIADDQNNLQFFGTDSLDRPVIIYKKGQNSSTNSRHLKILDTAGNDVFQQEPAGAFQGRWSGRFTLDSNDNLFFLNSWTEKIYKKSLMLGYLWPDTGIALLDSEVNLRGYLPDNNNGVLVNYRKGDSLLEYCQWIEGEGSLKYGTTGLFTGVYDGSWSTVTFSDSNSFILTYQPYNQLGSHLALKLNSNGEHIWPSFVNLGRPETDSQTASRAVPDGAGGIIYIYDDAGYVYATQLGENGGIGSITGILEPKRIPSTHTLISAYPNPFNPSATLEYEIPEYSDVSLTVYDVAGREVQTLVSISQAQGSYIVTWDGTDRDGHQVAGGMYFARLQAGEYSNAVKMIYLK